MTYDQEIVSQYNAANSYETVRHLAVDIGPRRSGTPEELEGATYLKGILDNLGFSLAQTLQAKASSPAGTGGDYAPVGGGAAPAALLSYANPTSNDAVTVGFRQTIGANEPLRTAATRRR